MSLDAMIWAVKDASVANVQEHSVLTVMADEADEAGCGVLLATGTIAERARLSKRQTQRCIDDMLERRLIGLGDQGLAAYIRADRRPVVYDLLIPYSWYGNPERVNRARVAKDRAPITPQTRPSIGPAPARKRRADLGAKRSAPNEMPSSHPVASGGVTASHPAEMGEVTASPPVHGVTSSPAGLLNTHGVTTKSEAETPPPAETASRGDYWTPDPIDPVIDPPPPQAPSTDPAVAADAEDLEEEGGTGQELNSTAARELLDDVLLSRLASRHRPKGPLRVRILEGLAAAFDAGWDTDQLDEQLSGNWDGVRSIGAVLDARITNLGPPPPRQVRPPKQPRCAKHPIHPPNDCPMCLTAAKTARENIGETLDGDTARALIRATTAEAARKRVPAARSEPGGSRRTTLPFDAAVAS